MTDYKLTVVLKPGIKLMQKRRLKAASSRLGLSHVTGRDAEDAAKVLSEMTGVERVKIDAVHTINYTTYWSGMRAIA